MEHLDFIQTPPQSCFCPFTREFLFQPYQTVCCGNHISETALCQLREKPCPFCGNGQLKCILDKFYQRQLASVNVRCSNSKLGCKWVGNVVLLKRHLNRDEKSPNADVTENEYESVDYDCGYVEISCLDCIEMVNRRDLKDHQMNWCVRRQHQCDYCGHKAPYNEVTIKHLPVCPRYPTTCPNGCGATDVPRESVQAHLKCCPNTRTPCALFFAGCEGYRPSETLSSHTKDRVVTHLDLLAAKVQYMETEMNKRDTIISEMHANIRHQGDTIRMLTHQLQILTGILAGSKDENALPVPRTLRVFLPPPDIILTNFDKVKRSEEWWFGPPFYTHVGGYKLCLAICPNGSGKFKGTHMSVTFHLMRGPFDDELVWPFRGELSVQLINQKKGKSQMEETACILEDTISDKATTRVLSGERSPSGFGFLQFISHKNLASLGGCLENDSVRLRVSKAVVY